MSGQTKKFRSKFFRVAVEGATTDGREIQRGWIVEMAASYNPAVYGARIWVEHLRSLLPEGPFRAYGDVLALKAEEVDINGEKRMALFAQVEPTDDLVNLVNNLRQKLYTSIEVSEKFADSGRAYLMGLAVTDTPASLGTEMLAFAAKHPESNPLANRKQDPANLFTAAAETNIEFEEAAVETGALEKLATMFASLLKPSSTTAAATAAATTGSAEFAATGEAILGHLRSQDAALIEIRRKYSEQSVALRTLQGKYDDLTKQLSSTPAGNQPQRPVSTGHGGNADLTDC